MSDSDDAVIAANRFGLGRRAGVADAGGAPARALAAQFARFEPAPPALANVPDRATVTAALTEYRQQAARGINLFDTPLPGSPRAAAAAAARRAGRGSPASAPAMADGMAPHMVAMSGDGAGAEAMQAERRAMRQDLRQHYVISVAARFDAALVSDTPFVERLVHFWSNHFAVSIDKVVTVGFAGLHEFEAIRPHVLGSFTSLAWAAVTHPAMLLYLDQAQSIGPDSPLAQRVGARRAAANRPIGLNENLAREILELHTLGVDGGYTQADVTEFARALTGITIPALAPGPARRLLGADSVPEGEVSFVPALHQPGARTILGRSYSAARDDTQARAIIGDLALHPKTARHLSFKLARHFVADDPPPALVDRLTAAWLAGRGDLTRWYQALLASPEAWQHGSRKAKSPWEWTVSAGRALGWRSTPRPQALVGLFNELGQPVWRPGSPAGYDDIAARWLAPDALLRRVEAANRMVLLSPETTDARALAQGLFGPALSASTAQAIAGAESNRQALALLLVSPEFLRR